jgi:Vacuolar sorting 38 and autophagy-related subunit 14
MQQQQQQRRVGVGATGGNRAAVGEPVNVAPALVPPGLRRVAHIRTIVARNLAEAAGADADRLFSCFFTLHRHLDSDSSSDRGADAGASASASAPGADSPSFSSSSRPEFRPSFISEVVRDSLNPDWRAMTLSDAPNRTRGFAGENVFSLRVWDIRGETQSGAAPASVAGAGPSLPGPSSSFHDESEEDDDSGLGTDQLLHEIEEEIAREQRRAARLAEADAQAASGSELELPSREGARVATSDAGKLFRMSPDVVDKVEVRLLFGVTVELGELVYAPPSSLVLPPNTLLFELEDGWYVLPPRLLENTQQQQLRGGAGAEGALSGALAQFPSGPQFEDFFRAARTKKPVSSSKNDLVAFLRIEQQLAAATDESAALRRQVSEQLGEQSESGAPASSSAAETVHAIHAARLRCERLRAIIADTRASNARGRRRLESERDALLPRIKAVSKAQMALVASRSMMEDDISDLQFDEEKLAVVERRILQRRWQLVHGLRAVYPITQAPKEPHLQIARLSLPNSEYTGCEEEHVATALGFVCHCVLLCSRYLDVALRYPMLPMGSRSVIQDTLGKYGVQQKFPLYSRGVERNRFDYAVFLLNKNIEQLLNSQGLAVITLRHTLPNLQILLSHTPPGVKDAHAPPEG